MSCLIYNRLDGCYDICTNEESKCMFRIPKMNSKMCGDKFVNFRKSKYFQQRTGSFVYKRDPIRRHVV